MAEAEQRRRLRSTPQSELPRSSSASAAEPPPPRLPAKHPATGLIQTQLQPVVPALRSTASRSELSPCTLRALFFCDRDRILQPLKFVGCYFFVVEQRKQQSLPRVSEEPLQDMTDLRPARFLFGNASRVDKRPALLPMLHISLLFKDPDCGQHRVVGQSLALGDRRDQVAYGRLPATPQDLHEPQLSFRQRDGLL